MMPLQTYKQFAIGREGKYDTPISWLKEEWAEFVVKNRKNNTETPIHHYDIVIGPIADDTVGVQIRRFVMGYLSASKLVEELKFKGDHAIQYFFGTPRAVELLKRIEL